MASMSSSSMTFLQRLQIIAFIENPPLLRSFLGMRTRDYLTVNVVAAPKTALSFAPGLQEFRNIHLAVTVSYSH